MQTSSPSVATDLPVARAGLAAVRSRLLRQYVGLGPGTLQSRELWPQTTPALALARIARRDDDAACSIEALLHRRARKASIALEGATADYALASFLAARSRLLSAVAKLHSDAPLAPSSPTMTLLARCRDLDVRWARRLEWWNEEQQIPFEAGPVSILTAAVRAARKELLTALALLPSAARPGWRAQLLARSRSETQLLRSLNPPPGPGAGPGVDGLPELAWEDTWRQFHDTHHALVMRLDTWGPPLLEDLALYRQITASIDRDRAVALAVWASRSPEPPTAAAGQPAAAASQTRPSGPEKSPGPLD